MALPHTACIFLYFLLLSTIWPSHARDLAEGLTEQSPSVALENKTTVIRNGPASIHWKTP